MRLIYIIVLLSILITSCFEDRIELNLNEGNKKIAIEAWFSNLNKKQYAKVSYSLNYLGQPNFEFIKDASVILSTSTKEYNLEYTLDGKYELPTNISFQIGELYKLEVTHNDRTYEAEHIMRPCPEIANAGFLKATEDGLDSLDFYEAFFEFQEISGKGDAYYAIDFKPNSPDQDSLYHGGYADDEFFDGEYFDQITVGEQLYEVGDTAIIELYSIGKETYNFLIDIESEVFRDGPFDPPPANVRTNFTNGAIGYFIIGEAQTVQIIN